MKKLRRLLTNPYTGQLQMSTLYEYHAKVGTTASTIIWLLKPAKKGEVIYGYIEEDRYTPYMKGHAFRYADATRLQITNIRLDEYGEFVYVNKL